MIVTATFTLIYITRCFSLPLLSALLYQDLFEGDLTDSVSSQLIEASVDAQLAEFLSLALRTKHF